MLKVVFVLACLIGWCGVADAQYVLVLKNGRQIIVQSYREDGAMIRFSGLGGEAAIGKDQVQSIRRAGQSDRDAVSTLNLDRPSPPPPAPAPSAPSASTKAPEITPPAPSPMSDEQVPSSRAEEEKAYLKMVKELNEQLKELRERYALATRGNKGPEPVLFTSEEAFRGHQEDLLSRLRDAQFKAQGLPSGANATSPPFSLDPPPAYSEKQRELSELRNRIAELENRREKLVDEMKAKNFDTGSLFLD
jgi:hypothetical protein